MTLIGYYEGTKKGHLKSHRKEADQEVLLTLGELLHLSVSQFSHQFSQADNN